MSSCRYSISENAQNQVTNPIVRSNKQDKTCRICDKIRGKRRRLSVMTMQAVQMRTKALRTTISLVIGCFLLIPPLAVPSCERPGPEEESCCCCCCPCCQDSEPFAPENAAQDDGCSCRTAERHEEENSAAVVVSANDNKLHISLSMSSIEGSFEDHQNRPGDFGSGSLILPKRDQPLYILHSSFII
jgi:hypothetical protein